VFGSTELVGALHREGLVDEFRLMIDPVVVGGGKRLFGDDGKLEPLRLIDSRSRAPARSSRHTLPRSRGRECDDLCERSGVDQRLAEREATPANASATTAIVRMPPTPAITSSARDESPESILNTLKRPALRR
jgi:hypothetical protein